MGEFFKKPYGQAVMVEDKYDLLKANPSFHTRLNPAVGTIMQSYLIDEFTDEIYVGQTISEGEGKTESIVISSLDINGKLLHSMTIKYGGHGTIFSIETENDKKYIWTCYDKTSADGTPLNDWELARVEYTAGATVTIDSATVNTYNRFTTNQVFPVVDQKSDSVAFIVRLPNGNKFIELRKLSEVKTGIDKVYGRADIPTALNWWQGATLDENIFYWRTGDTNNATWQDQITVFDLTRGEQIQQIDCDFEAPLDNFREPEGIYLYTDKKTGKKSLFAGVVTGRTGRRVYTSYAYHQVGAGEKFNSEINSGSQLFPLTHNDGRCKYLPDTTLMSNVREPGSYYMTAVEASNFTDHPQPDGGYFLEVAPMNIDRNIIIQTLKKNTLNVNNICEFQRVVSIGKDGSANTTPWQPYQIGDTGWIEMKLEGGAIPYTDGKIPVYRKVGSIVEIKGTIKGLSTINNGSVTFFTLPTGFRPSGVENVSVICNGSNADKWLLTVEPTGVVRASRYTTPSGFPPTMSGNEWLPFSVMYTV